MGFIPANSALSAQGIIPDCQWLLLNFTPIRGTGPRAAIPPYPPFTTPDKIRKSISDLVHAENKYENKFSRGLKKRASLLPLHAL